MLAVIDTHAVSPQSSITISITARSNVANAANGNSQDSGTIINSVGAGARLTDPSNSTLAPNKLVNGLAQAVVSTGAPFTYTINFRNSGGAPARNVVMTDKLAAGISYVPGSLQLNDQPLSDAIDTDTGSFTVDTVEVRLPRVDAGQAMRITFQARLTAAIPSGAGLINHADFTSDNAPPVRSVQATVVFDPFGLVFAARGGSSSPIPGARVELLQDSSGGNFLSLPANGGFVPNAQNANPFATDAFGHFSFKLATDAIGTSTTEANYFMRISAAGFLTRMIQLTLRPTQAGLFTLNAHALDGQALAGSDFALISGDLQVENLAALVMNIPMFEATGLQIIKSADRARAEIGDMVTYRVEVRNPTMAALRDVTVEDRLPSSFHYAAGSGLLGVGSTTQRPIEPQANPDKSGLIFTIGELPAGASAQLLYRLRIGANAADGAQDNLAVGSGVFPSGDRTQTQPARATVYVTAGIFSARQVLIGRVFVDVNRNGQFDDGDRPAPGARLYLNNGQSVITDSAGMYNFPALGDGPQVISLDPVTVASHYALSDGGRLSGRSWTRLLRTPIGGGAMLRQNFPLIDTSEPPAVAGGPASSPSASADASKSVPPALAGGPMSVPPALAGGSATSVAKDPAKPGTYEYTTTETVEAVGPGRCEYFRRSQTKSRCRRVAD